MLASFGVSAQTYIQTTKTIQVRGVEYKIYKKGSRYYYLPCNLVLDHNCKYVRLPKRKKLHW
jgi:hypothetical protein